MKYGVLYDYLQVAGGSERMALDLCRGLPNSALIVSRIFSEAEALISEFEGRIETMGNHITKPLGRVIESAYCFKRHCRPPSTATANFYLGNFAPLAVHRQKGGKKIFYCNTPPRFAYDWSEEYRQRQRRWLRRPFDLFVKNYRRAYEQAAAEMDVVIANSENIRRRIKKYLGIDAQIIYPPVDTKKYRWLAQGNYFVSTARLMPYKRIDVIVDAFRQMPDQRLVVLSGGPELTNLQQRAAGADNITFTGWQSEAQLLHWIGNARAAIYLPKEEDFGLSPVEAMAAGKPVIGVAEGGLVETIADRQTGLLLPSAPTVADLIEAVRHLQPEYALQMRSACESRAKLFSRDIFLKQMQALAD